MKTSDETTPLLQPVFLKSEQPFLSTQEQSRISCAQPPNGEHHTFAPKKSDISGKRGSLSIWNLAQSEILLLVFYLSHVSASKIFVLCSYGWMNFKVTTLGQSYQASRPHLQHMPHVPVLSTCACRESMWKKENGTSTRIINHCICPMNGLNAGCWEDNVIKNEHIWSNILTSEHFIFYNVSRFPFIKSVHLPCLSPNLEWFVSPCNSRGTNQKS